MAYVIEIDDSGYYLRDTSTGLRTQYSSRDHLMHASATIALRSWDRVLEGIERVLESYERPRPLQTEVEP